MATFDKNADLRETVDNYKELVEQCKRVCGILTDSTNNLEIGAIGYANDGAIVVVHCNTAGCKMGKLEFPTDYLTRKNISKKEWGVWRQFRKEERARQQREAAEDAEYQKFCELRVKWEDRYERECRYDEPV